MVTDGIAVFRERERLCMDREEELYTVVGSI